jgi:molecular chaperone HscB
MSPVPPVTSDYFGAFGLDRRLTVDTAELQSTFYRLSRQFHPDRFATRSPEDQQRALDFTALLNDAYRVLRDPLQRAEYLLKLEGFDIGEQRSKDVPPELLEEVFELNMMLESAPDRDELESAKQRFQSMQDDVDTELQTLFSEFDNGGGRQILARVRGVLNRRRYIQNLLRDVDKALDSVEASA